MIAQQGGLIQPLCITLLFIDSETSPHVIRVISISPVYILYIVLDPMVIHPEKRK